MPIKKIISLNDICSYGKVSLTVSIPIFSKLGIQLCPLPTVLLSSHTQFPSFYAYDLSEQIIQIIEQWEKLNISFDGLYVGYLLGEKQNDIARDIIKIFNIDNVIIDPILGDNGHLYTGFDDSHIQRMKNLISASNIITPNTTEAALLLGEKYDKNVDLDTIKNWARILSEYGPKKVVITSVEIDDKIGAIAYDNGEITISMRDKINLHIPGTGDAFSSTLFAYYINGYAFNECVDKSVKFVGDAVAKSLKNGDEPIVGIAIENMLDLLD